VAAISEVTVPCHNAYTAMNNRPNTRPPTFPTAAVPPAAVTGAKAGNVCVAPSDPLAAMIAANQPPPRPPDPLELLAGRVAALEAQFTAVRLAVILATLAGAVAIIVSQAH
jgi:hypothetical protein